MTLISTHLSVDLRYVAQSSVSLIHKPAQPSPSQAATHSGSNLATMLKINSVLQDIQAPSILIKHDEKNAIETHMKYDTSFLKDSRYCQRSVRVSSQEEISSSLKCPVSMFQYLVGFVTIGFLEILRDRITTVVCLTDDQLAVETKYV